MAQVYIAGHMLDKGAVMLRSAEQKDIEELGYDIYNPINNKEINDKAKANPDGLAERIVQHDTSAIIYSDVIVLEPQPYALGTHVELGQILGMKDQSQYIIDIIQEMDAEGANGRDIVDAIYEECRLMVDKKVLPHMEDIRRQGQTETGDRRSLGINQYVYGACLKLTDGKGFYEWEEVLDELRQG